ncbi:MAG: DUF4142 domain-containing protein [Balneolaceae bacterium]|nr:DUF4142 domain-containing protein [Balneolaceae bacterium]
MLSHNQPIYILVLLFTISAMGNALWAQSQDKLNDAEIAHIAVTANKIDVETARLAKKKSDHPDVVSFAETMINDHTAVIDKAKKLANRLGVKPRKNPTSKKLMNDARDVRSMLRNKSGTNFNKAYINHEVNYHKAVINTIDDVLIPNTSNVELKQLLEGALPALKAHLQQAENIQEKLSGNASY